MIYQNSIYIRNIYHMLAYAFQVLNENTYKKLETEEFDNISDLLSEILILGVRKQIKLGLVKDYVEVSEDISSPKGKINITESVNTLTIINGKLNCTYDEFSLDCHLNRILKSTLNILIKSDISKSRKKKLKNLLAYFAQVKLIDVGDINWKIRFDRNNQTYKMLINICYLIVHSLLHTEKAGKTKLMDFSADEKILNRLYERFILNYYRKEYPEILAHAPYIEWQIDSGYDSLLPKMKSDVTLEYGDKILIIDAKFYTHNTRENFRKNIHHTGNLYQIFTYVKNKQTELQEKDIQISGMLLYAGTNESIQPDSDYVMSGNKISVKTLNLNLEFGEIKNQLNNIVEKTLLK